MGIGGRVRVVEVGPGRAPWPRSYGGISARLAHGRQETQVPVHIKSRSSPAELRVGAPARDGAVVDLDPDRALRNQAELILGLVVIDARRLQCGRQMAEAQGLRQPC